MCLFLDECKISQGFFLYIIETLFGWHRNTGFTDKFPPLVVIDKQFL